jgi:TonB family protein
MHRNPSERTHVGLPSSRQTQKTGPVSTSHRCLQWLVALALGCSAQHKPVEEPRAPLARPAPQQSIEAARPDPAPHSPTPRAAVPQHDSDANLVWLSPRHVGAAVRAHQGAFSACQTLADAGARSQTGAVTVAWWVQANGRVAKVSVGPSSFESHRVNDCVLSVAKQVTFPASPAPTQVSWTVKFRGAANGRLAAAGSR